MRADKAQQFLAIADAVSKLSKDPSTKVGCVILDSETLIVKSIGYNGFPRGVDETIASRWDRETKLRYICHAEQNAVSQAAHSGTCLKNATIVCTMFPCNDCSKSIIQAGIKKIVTKEITDDLKERWGESFKYSKIMFEESKVEVQFVRDG